MARPLTAATIAAAVLAGPATPAIAAPPPSSVRECQPQVPTTYGGRTVGADVSPADPSLVLAATDSGGVFGSTDGGSH